MDCRNGLGPSLRQRRNCSSRGAWGLPLDCGDVSVLINLERPTRTVAPSFANIVAWLPVRPIPFHPLSYGGGEQSVAVGSVGRFCRARRVSACLQSNWGRTVWSRSEV